MVITIIVLLILAAVSIATLTGENGILNKATDASQKTKFASEKEAIEFIMQDIKTSQMIDEEVPKDKYLGEDLKNRQLGDWKIVTVGDTIYGTDWYLLEKGKEIEGYGKSNLSWLINYNTGEIVELEEGKYSYLSSSDSVIESARNNIIFNLDAAIIGSATSITDLESANVDFIGFEDINENSGLTENSFKFDGVNDYIKVQYDEQEQKEELAKNGFTFEFYGKWDGGTTDPRANIETDGLYRGLFCYWNGNEQQNAIVRFGIYENADIMAWNAGGYKLLSDFSGSIVNPHNIFYKIKLDELRKGAYITITLDTSKSYMVTGKKYSGIGDGNGGEYNTDILKEGEYYKQTVYMNGTKIYEGDYNKEAWDNFTKGDLKNLKYFCIGRSSMSKDGWWHYSKMDAYTLRLYNRALTDEEIEMSYNNSKLLLKDN